MKKKLLFTIYNLDLGGTEKAFINLIKTFDFSQYDVDVLIQEKKGVFLEKLPKEVRVIDFKYKEAKNIFLRIRNKLKLIYFKKVLKGKYDFAGCFTSWNYNCADVIVNVCENSALWIHENFLSKYNGDIQRLREFMDTQKIGRFKKIVFVSEDAKNAMKQAYPELEDNMVVCENYIDNKEICELADEEIYDERDNRFLFVNISRHSEEEKSISRILHASKRLKDEGYKFCVWLVGNGKDTEKYKELVEKEHLEDVIEFKGVKTNPYPYYKIADAHILCSNNEGYGLSNIESLILDTPVITTDVAGMADMINNKYGYVVSKDVDGVYGGMKKMLNEKFVIEERYPIEEINAEIVSKFKKIIED